MSPLVVFLKSLYISKDQKEFKRRRQGKTMGRWRGEGRERSGQGSREAGKKENAEKSQQNQMIQKLVPSPDQ